MTKNSKIPTLFSISSNFIVGMFTLSLLQGVGPTIFFLGLAIVQFISILFYQLYVPETKNKSLEQLEKELMI